MEPTSSKSVYQRQLFLLAGFTVAIALVSGLLSLVARLWIALPWWKVFRRCVSIGTLLVLWAFMRYGHRLPVRSLGLGPWRQGRVQLALGVLLGVTALTALSVLYLVSGVLTVSIYPDRARVVRTLLIAPFAMALVGIMEELIFRGYIFKQLRLCSEWLAVIGSSVVYALVHLRTDVVWPGSCFELVGLFILGCVLAIAVVQTGQLYLSIGLHASLAFGARVNKQLVEFASGPPGWLVGTSRLVNGVVAWVLIGSLAVLIMRYARQRSAVP